MHIHSTKECDQCKLYKFKPFRFLGFGIYVVQNCSRWVECWFSRCNALCTPVIVMFQSRSVNIFQCNHMHTSCSCLWLWGLVRWNIGCVCPGASACSVAYSIEPLVLERTLLLLYRASFWSCRFCLSGQAAVTRCLFCLFPYYLSSPLVQYLPLFVGENIVRGEKDSIRNLLEIFDGLLEYLTEQLSEEEEIPNGGEHFSFLLFLRWGFFMCALVYHPAWAHWFWVSGIVLGCLLPCWGTLYFIHKLIHMHELDITGFGSSTSGDYRRLFGY